jgi:hypothetical protein
MLPWPVQRCVLGIRAMVAGAVAKAPAAGATTRTGAGRTWGLGRSDLWRAGVLAAEDDGNRLVCHACGQAFRSLGTMWALVRSMGAHARSYRSATASRVLWSNRSATVRASLLSSRPLSGRSRTMPDQITLSVQLTGSI